MSQQQQQFVKQFVNLSQTSQIHQIKNLNKIKVDIFLIRHGYSIANRDTTDNPTKIKGLVGKTYECDPSLTKTGVEQSKDASRMIHDLKPEYIFTSVLCRAQQTALFMFPTEQKVIVAPYLKEENNYVDPLLKNSDNKPFADIFTQYEKRHNFLSKENLQRLQYSDGILNKDGCTYNNESRDISGSIKDFLEIFLYPFLKEKFVSKERFTAERNVKIAVVCHGNLIKQFLGITKVCNNAVFKVSFPHLSDMEKISRQGQVSGGGASAKFKHDVIFNGYEQIKLSCKRDYVVRSNDKIVSIKYPYEKISQTCLPRQTTKSKTQSQQQTRQRHTQQQSSPYTRDQLLQIFTNQIVKVPIGKQQQRTSALIHEIMKLKQTQGRSTQGQGRQQIHQLINKYPILRTLKRGTDIKSFLKTKNQLKPILFNTKEQFKKMLKLIAQNRLGVENEDAAINLINQQIQKDRSLRNNPDQIYELIMHLTRAKQQQV